MIVSTPGFAYYSPTRVRASFLVCLLKTASQSRALIRMMERLWSDCSTSC